MYSYVHIYNQTAYIALYGDYIVSCAWPDSISRMQERYRAGRVASDSAPVRKKGATKDYNINVTYS